MRSTAFAAGVPPAAPAPALGPAPDLPDAPLETLVDAWRARGRGEPGAVAGFLVLGPSSERLLDRFERRLASQGGRVAAAGGWWGGPPRPFAGLAEVVDQLAGQLLDGHPELLRRYNLALVNLLPAWRRLDFLRSTREMRSGIADFVLYGDRAGLDDFYWRRDNAPLVIADLVHLTVGAVATLAEGDARIRGPVVLRFDGLDRADSRSLEALRLLATYARRSPLWICATAAEWTTPEVAAELGSGASGAWRTLRPDAGAARGGARRVRTPAGERLLEAASVAALPLRAADLPRWSAEANGLADELLAAGRLRLAGEGRFVPFSAAQRGAVYGGLTAARRRELHLRALEIEADDPFAAAWHARAAGRLEESARYARRALEPAWGVSHHGSVLTLAELSLAAGEARPDGHLLRALVHYDAGRHGEADRGLRAAVEAAAGEEEASLLRRLLAYNAIFGLGEFDRGRTILEEDAARCEAEGRHQEAGYLRNSVAFALFRSGRIDDAVAMEKRALASVERSGQAAGGCLSSVLQLNLGRLQRNLGLSEEAIELFRGALEEQSDDGSPYMLLIFHSTLAVFHADRGEDDRALAAFERCFELARDLKLEYASYPVMGALAAKLGLDLGGRLTRGDEFFCLLYVRLALVCRRLGLEGHARAYEAGVGRLLGPSNRELWTAVANVLEATEVERSNPPHGRGFGRAARKAERSRAARIRATAAGPAALAAAADALSEGRVVAVVLPWPGEPGPVTSLALYDPRRPELARRIHAEVGFLGLGWARCGVLLPEEAGRFDDLDGDLPLVYQEASLKARQRAELPALEPVGARLQVLSPALAPELHEILEGFRRRTGLGLASAVPFHLRGRDLATTPREALHAFLVSSVDRLLLGDRLLEKTAGAVADENLLSACPRLARHATLVDADASAADESAFLVRIRAASYRSSGLRLRGEMRPLLELSNGRRTVAEILARLRAEGAGPWSENDVCGFLRQLWRRDVLRFDPSPTLPEAEEAT